MIAAYIILGAIAALMLAGSVAVTARAGEKDRICQYDRDDVGRG